MPAVLVPRDLEQVHHQQVRKLVLTRHHLLIRLERVEEDCPTPTAEKT